MTIQLYSNTFCIEVESTSINLLKAFQSCRILPTIIPGIQIIQAKNTANISYKIIHFQEASHSISKQNKVFLIHEIWSDNDIPGYIIFFIYKLFDYLYLSKNYLSFHSSAISKNNKSILLVGPAGSGKTGTMLHMVLTKGYDFLSNNRTVIDVKKGNIIAGTSHISIRKEDLFRYQNVIRAAISYDTVTGFQILEQYEIGIKQAQKFPQALSAIALIKITNDASRFQEIASEIAIYKLYENISRTQWGEGLLFAGQKISPTLDTEKTAQKRLDLLLSLLQQQHFYEISGSIQFIEENIEKVLALSL